MKKLSSYFLSPIYFIEACDQLLKQIDKFLSLEEFILTRKINPHLLPPEVLENLRSMNDRNLSVTEIYDGFKEDLKDLKNIKASWEDVFSIFRLIQNLNDPQNPPPRSTIRKPIFHNIEPDTFDDCRILHDNVCLVYILCSFYRAWHSLDKNGVEQYKLKHLKSFELKKREFLDEIVEFWGGDQTTAELVLSRDVLTKIELIKFLDIKRKGKNTEIFILCNLVYVLFLNFFKINNLNQQHFLNILESLISLVAPEIRASDITKYTKKLRELHN